jgi:hypothetical protein
MVRAKVDPEPVNNTVPPLAAALTVTVVPVADPESPFKVVIPPPPPPAACHEGGAPLLAVNTYPGVPLLASKDGTPVFEVIRTPLLTAEITPSTFALEAYIMVLIAFVVGYVVVDHTGVVDDPDIKS